MTWVGSVFGAERGVRGRKGRNEEKTERGRGACSSWFARMNRILYRTVYLPIVLAHEDVIVLVFSHPDYTVGPGTSPGPASPYKEWLAGSTADQELKRQLAVSPHLAPKT